MHLRRKISTFLACTPAERWWFIQAVMLLLLTGLGASLAGFRRCYAALSCWASLVDQEEVPATALYRARRIGRMVCLAVRYSPYRPTCLQRSLVLWALLRRRGVAGDLHMGTRLQAGQFEAHAWVEYQGVVLNDRPDIRQHFVPFNVGILPHERRCP